MKFGSMSCERSALPMAPVSSGCFLGGRFVGESRQQTDVRVIKDFASAVSSGMLRIRDVATIN